MANNLVFEKKTQNFTAYQQAQIGIAGNFFKIVDSTNTSAPPTISLIKNGVVIGNMSGFSIGDYVKDIDFDAVIIKNGAVAQNLTYMICSGGAGSDRTVGSVSITGNLAGIDGDVKTREQVDKSDVFFKSFAALAANNAQEVVAPALNVNGLIVDSFQLNSYGASANPEVSFLASAGVPAGVSGGDVLGFVKGTNGSNLNPLFVDRPIKIEAGKGLYFISTVAESFGARIARVKIL